MAVLRLQSSGPILALLDVQPIRLLEGFLLQEGHDFPLNVRSSVLLSVDFVVVVDGAEQ